MKRLILAAFMLSCLSMQAQRHLFPYMDTGLDASKPSSCHVPYFYGATDTHALYQCLNGVLVLVSGSGSGSVTSVGMTVPSSVFNIAGSPITTTGTLALSFATQAPNTHFAGPTTGSPAAPTFRAMVTADLPSAGVMGGDLSGSFPNPVVHQINGAPMPFNGLLSANSSHQLINSTAPDVSGALLCQAGSASGTAYACSTPFNFTALQFAVGTELLFKADVANTGAATLNVNTIGAIPIKKQGGGTALVANDLLAGQYALLIYDGTNWQMQGQIGNAPGGSGTVTHTLGALGLNALVAGNSGGDIQTPNTSATLDSSGNISTPGGLSTGVGGTVAGFDALGNGTAPSIAANALTIYAPATITTGFAWVVPSAENASPGIPHIGAASSHVSTWTISALSLSDLPSGATQTIASGTAAMGTSAIASGACATAVTVSASGVATTDVLGWGFNGDPTAVTGYTPTTNGMLTIIAYPTANNVNFKVCNNTSASVTPGAVTLNFRVTR